MTTRTPQQKSFPKDDYFDHKTARPINLGFDFETYAQGPFVWWRMEQRDRDFKDATAGYYGSLPKTFSKETLQNRLEPDDALAIAVLSSKTRERFYDMPGTDRHYSADHLFDKSNNNIFYPRIWDRENMSDPMMLMVPRLYAESMIAIVDAQARYIHASLPSPLLWPYVQMSCRVLSTTIMPGNNSNPVFSNWHSHASKSRNPGQQLYKGILAVSNGLPTRFASHVEKTPLIDFNGAAQEGAIIETGKRQVKIIEGLQVSPPDTLVHFGDGLEHDGSINLTGRPFNRRFTRCFYSITAPALSAALRAHPDIARSLSDERRLIAQIYNQPV